MKKIGLQLALKCQNSKLRVRTKTCSPRNSSRGFNSSSGKTTNHPLHLHQRILLVQQHERCSLRRWWFLGNPPPQTKNHGSGSETGGNLASSVSSPRSSKLTEAPNPWLYCDFLSPTGETARSKATPGGKAHQRSAAIFCPVTWRKFQRVFNDPNCSQKAHRQSGNAKISWFQLKFE